MVTTTEADFCVNIGKMCPLTAKRGLTRLLISSYVSSKSFMASHGTDLKLSSSFVKLLFDLSRDM